MSKPTIAIIGAGASGLMVADLLSDYGVQIEVYEQMPSAGRKILWAGKTGLNITHSEPMEQFVRRYLPDDWLTDYLYQYSNEWLREWFDKLGIETFVGSSGRVFPVAMKGSPFLRAWLNRLHDKKVQFFYRHSCVSIQNNAVHFNIMEKSGKHSQLHKKFDAIILACGGGSYKKLGSDGKWQAWFNHDELSPLYASNVGIMRAWSEHMTAYFGKALKRIAIYDDKQKIQGDVIISHYGFESSLIYRLNPQMKKQLSDKGQISIQVDLLPDRDIEYIHKILNTNKKYSLNNKLKKLGLDNTKIALLRECSNKKDWTDMAKMATLIKALPITFMGFRPMNEAISTGGGVKRKALTKHLQLKSNPYVFCCGEMLDFDAPTGGYLLTACFATGRVAGQGVVEYLGLTLKCPMP